MRVRVLLPLLSVGIATAIVLLVARQLPGDASAAGKWKMIVVNVAADSAPPAPTATPPFNTDRQIAMLIELEGKELAASGVGFTLVHMTATVSAVDMPTALDPVVTATGTFSIAPHPPDSAGCTWERTMTKDTFKVTFYYTQDLSIVADMETPEWYYTVQCPAPGAPPIRFPAFGEEGLFHFLREIIEPYRQGNGVRLPMDVVAEVPVSCIKRHFKVERPETSFTGFISVEVFVYQPGFPGGCLLPI
jgi:hypothetical protein